MALQNSVDPRGTKSRRRRSRLTVESLEQRVPLAADVVTAIAPISMSVEPFPGSGKDVGGQVGEPIMVICVMPEPGVIPSFENPAVTGGPDGGSEALMFATTTVQRTNTPGVRPATLVSQRLGDRPRIGPAAQQAARQRRMNEAQATSLPVTRQPQVTGHFSRQIAARFARLSASVIR
jgi:hypothetical protein